MRFVLASTFVPFVYGGARFIVEWLEEKLIEHGHEVERFYLPFVETPDDLLTQTAAIRLMDVADAGDRLICFRPPSYVLRHPHKTLWFIHHIRTYYDLWGTEYGVRITPQSQALREAIHTLDNQAFGEAQRIFTNSKIVADRLHTFNRVKAEPLYPPIYQPERFHCRGYGDEVVFVCRIEPHKRPQLLLEAMKHVQTPVRLRLCGRASSPAYGEGLLKFVRTNRLEDRVSVEDRWITEDEKIEILSQALALAYVPKDEDSYGYPSLEAGHAGKAVLTTTDSGGVLELIEDGVNGFVVSPDPRAVAARFDELWRDRDRARRMGEANAQRLKDLRIDWNRVVEAFTS